MKAEKSFHIYFLSFKYESSNVPCATFLSVKDWSFIFSIFDKQVLILAATWIFVNWKEQQIFVKIEAFCKNLM